MGGAMGGDMGGARLRVDSNPVVPGAPQVAIGPCQWAVSVRRVVLMVRC